MNISFKWLGEFVDLGGALGAKALAELLTNRGLEVEEVKDLAAGFDKVVTAKILERTQHPQADRLSLCKVVAAPDAAPEEIVCGATNMKAGDVVVLATPGAHLPNGTKIERSKIRGVLSNGMLCSEQELCIAGTSAGIMILPPDTPLGRPAAEALGRDDVILSFKLTANRGDCLSHYGMAREVAAALGRPARLPETMKLPDGGCPVTISLEAGDAAPQFWGCYIEGVKIGPSPAWLSRRLETLGMRSINNVVDATNLVMLELGHPVHAYDADFIQGGKIGVRYAKKAEKLPLLDGTEIELHGDELVIFDAGRAIGLAGVMGGGNSEVQPHTTRLFLECVEFSPSLVRRASQRHQKKTEAAHRFERGIDPRGLEVVMSRLAKLITALAGGAVMGAACARTGETRGAAKIEMDRAYFSRFLGVAFTPEFEREAVKILTLLDCTVENHGEKLSVTPPGYRRDLGLREDLAEEIARSIGYDKIPSTVPVLTTQPWPMAGDAASVRLGLIEAARDALARTGLQEAVNFAFTGKKWLSELGFVSSAPVVNPLSEEHEMLVPSLVPGLVRNALDNWRLHFGSDVPSIRLFELRPTFHSKGAVASSGEMETGVEERWKVAFALSGPRLAGGLKRDLGELDFSDVKGVVESFFALAGLRGIRILPASQARNKEDPVLKLLHPGWSAEVLAGNAVAGYFGLLHPGTARGIKARAPLWIGEFDWDAISKLMPKAGEVRKFKAWPALPPMERDFALVVKKEITADKIIQGALKAGKPLAKVAKVFDIYNGPPVPEGMTSVAVRVIFFDEGRSLQDQETEAAGSRIVDLWKKELGAELRS